MIYIRACRYCAVQGTIPRQPPKEEGTIPRQPPKEEGTRTLPSPKLDVSTCTKSEPTTPPPLPLLSTSTPHRTKSSDTRVPTPYEDGILSPITLSQVTFLELSMQCADDHAPTPTMSDKVLSDFGLRELTEQDLKEFSDCTTLDTSLCTASASLGASGRGKASHDNTETESATLHNVSAGFVLLKYHDSTSPPVTYRGTHDDVPRPSVFHFPGPHSIPSSVSFHSQVGTLLDAKLKHPHPYIRSRRLTVLQGRKQLMSHDAEEVYEAFMSAADPHQFQVGEEGLMHQ